MRRLAVTMWCFISLVLLVPTQAVLAGVIAQGRLEWAAASNLSFDDDSGDVYPYTITGPGVLIVTYTVTPYVERVGYSSKSSLLGYDSSEWKVLKSEVLYGGRPASSFKPEALQPDGSISSYKSRTEYAIPNRTFTGKFTLIEPKKCGLNSCYRFQAAAAFTAEFIPQGQVGSTSQPQSGSGDDRQQRLDAITRGAKQYADKDYAGAVATLDKALTGSEKVFTDADKPVVDKARKLLDKAREAARTSGATPTTTTTATGSSGPPCPSNASTPTLQVCSASVRPGESFSLPVWLLAGRDLANCNAEIKYDPAVVQATGKGTKGGLLGKALFESNTAVSGATKIGFASATGISGAGQITALPFKAVGKPGQRTAVSVRITTANNATGATTTVATLNGVINIADDMPPSPTSTTGSATGQTPIPTPGSQTGGTTGTSSTTSGTPAPQPTFTALDALTALKMSVGNLPPDMKYDLDQTREITSNDARLILMRVVGK